MLAAALLASIAIPVPLAGKEADAATALGTVNGTRATHHGVVVSCPR